MENQEKRSVDGLIESIFQENYDKAAELANEMQKKTNEVKEKLISALMDFTEQEPIGSKKRQLQKLFSQIKTYQIEDLRKTATEAGNKAFGKILSIPSDDERIPVISRILALADISRLNTIEIRGLINQVKANLGGESEKGSTKEGKSKSKKEEPEPKKWKSKKKK